MPERNAENRRIKEFESRFSTALDELLDNASILLTTPMPPDPLSLGIDERTLHELTTEELNLIRRVLFSKLKVDITDPIRTYQTGIGAEVMRPSGVMIPAHSMIQVSVFRTNRESEGLYLQELTYPDSVKGWVIGPDQNI